MSSRWIAAVGMLLGLSVAPGHRSSPRLVVWGPGPKPRLVDWGPGPKPEPGTSRPIDGAPPGRAPVADLAVRPPRYVAPRDPTPATFFRSAKAYKGRLWLAPFTAGI